MGIFSIAKSNDSDHFSLLFSRLLDHRYQIRFYSIHHSCRYFREASLTLGLVAVRFLCRTRMNWKLRVNRLIFIRSYQYTSASYTVRYLLHNSEEGIVTSLLLFQDKILHVWGVPSELVRETQGRSCHLHDCVHTKGDRKVQGETHSAYGGHNFLRWLSTAHYTPLPIVERATSAEVGERRTSLSGSLARLVPNAGYAKGDNSGEVNVWQHSQCVWCYSCQCDGSEGKLNPSAQSSFTSI